MLELKKTFLPPDKIETKLLPLVIAIVPATFVQAIGASRLDAVSKEYDKGEAGQPKAIEFEAVLLIWITDR